MYPVGFPQGGRGRGGQDGRPNHHHPVGFSEYRVLVQHKPSSQESSDADSGISLATVGNIHGAIGRQRANGNSVSFSSSSSTTNSPERADFKEEGQPCAHLASSSPDSLHYRKDANTISLVAGAGLPLVYEDLIEVADQCGANNIGTPSPLGVSVQPQASLAASELGRPISKQNDPALTNSSVPEINPGLLHQDSSQYSQNPTGGNQVGYNTVNAASHLYSPEGYTTADGFREAGKHLSLAQTGEYFTSSFSSLANGSQDFSIPPPVCVPTTAIPPVTGSLLPMGVYPPTSTLPARRTQLQPSPSISESIKKVITCSQCKTIHKWPHTLHCLHVFCFPCLTAQFDPADQSIICRKCAMKTSLKDGLCSLKMDSHSTRTMLQLNISPFMCTACFRCQEAVICCQTCMAYLCCSCQEDHRNMKHFLNHKLVPITKLRKIANGVHTNLCDLHPLEPMRNYCCVCDHMICAECVPDHKHPKPHCCPTVAEVFPIVAETLFKWKDDADDKAKDMSGIVQEVQKSNQQYGQRKRKVTKEIEEYVAYLLQVAEQNKWSTGELLKYVFSQLEKESEIVISNAQKACDEMKTFKEFTKRTVHCDAPEDTLILLEIMKDAYKRAVVNCTKVTEHSKRILAGVTFTPNYKETHDILNQNFACIQYPNNQGVSSSNLLTDVEISRKSLNFTPPGGNSNQSYQTWSATPETMPISTWNCVSDSEKKNSIFIPHLNCCRTMTSYIHTFGEYGDGEYSFTEPSGQAYLRDGSYVICDSNNHRIVHYSANHEYLRTIGQLPNLPPLADRADNHRRGKVFTRQDGYLYFPNRVAVCPLSQNIIATERPPSHDIQIFTLEGHFLRCFGGNILQHPRGVTVDEQGIIIVIECKIMKLVMFSQDGSLIASHCLSQGLEFPNDIAVKDRKIFISDNRGHCVLVFNYNAEFLYKIGSELMTYFPIGVSINHLNQVVVTHNHNTFNITVFDMAGTILHNFESVSKLAQCCNASVHPSRLELMLSTKYCSVYVFSYDPEGTHALKPPHNYRSGNAVSRAIVRR